MSKWRMKATALQKTESSRYMQRIESETLAIRPATHSKNPKVQRKADGIESWHRPESLEHLKIRPSGGFEVLGGGGS